MRVSATDWLRDNGLGAGAVLRSSKWAVDRVVNEVGPTGIDLSYRFTHLWVHTLPEDVFAVEYERSRVQPADHRTTLDAVDVVRDRGWGPGQDMNSSRWNYTYTILGVFPDGVETKVPYRGGWYRKMLKTFPRDVVAA